MDILTPLHAVPGFLNMYHLNHRKYPKALIAIHHRCGVSNPQTLIVSWWQHIHISILTMKKRLAYHYVLNLWSILIGWQVIWPNVGGTINLVWCNKGDLVTQQQELSVTVVIFRETFPFLVSINLNCNQVNYDVFNQNLFK